MDRINELSDDLLIKILSFVRTKAAVSTSILSKRWEFLWMLVPNLEYNDYEDITKHTNRLKSSYRKFLDKNLPLHRAPIIERLSLTIYLGSVKPKDIKLCVGFAVSRCLRELILRYDYCDYKALAPSVFLPSSFYSCKSLVALKLIGREILVDLPPTVCLPSLKTLQLRYVRYFSDDSLRLFLSYCPVLEDLVIQRHVDDNIKGLVVIVPSLKRLSLGRNNGCSSDGYVIDTPSLKYFKVEDYGVGSSYLIKHMPKLEEADITVQKGLEQFLESITSVKRLSLQVLYNNEKESMYRAGIVFDQLEHLKLCICSDYWSKLLVRLLNDSPKLRILNISGADFLETLVWKPDQINWDIGGSLIPECLLKTLETFKFAGCKETPEDKDFLSFILRNARRLKFRSVCTLS